MTQLTKYTLSNPVTALEVSNNFLVKDLQKCASDFKLSKLNFSTGENPIRVLTEFILTANALQSAALSKHLSVESCAALPELSTLKTRESWQKAIDFISKTIVEIADFFGVKFIGDILLLSDRIIEDFGGLTLLDLVKFANDCKSMKYNTEYQNLSTRGLTTEFVLDWLKAYTDERFSALYSSSKHIDGVKSERNNEMQKISDIEIDYKNPYSGMDSRCKEAREKWELSLTEIKSMPFTDEKGNTSNVPLRVDSENAAYQRLFLTLSSFVKSEDTKTLLSQFAAKIKEKGGDKDYIRATAKQANNRLINAVNSTKPQTWIVLALKTRHKEQSDLIGIMKSYNFEITDKDGKPMTKNESLEPFKVFNNFSNFLLNQLTEGFLQYCETKLQNNRPPLSLHHYQTAMVMVWLESYSFENPILNDFKKYL